MPAAQFTTPQRLLLAVVAAVVLTTMFEPVGFVLSGPLAIAGYTLALRGARLRSAVGISLVFGVVFSYLQLWWMRAVGTGAWFALSAIESAYFLVLGPVVALLLRRRYWPVWVAAAWLAYESTRASWPFGGFPWARLAFGTVDTPFARLLPWVGMPGVTFVLALLGTLGAYALVRAQSHLGHGPDAPGFRGLRRIAPRTAALLVVPPVVLLAVVALAAARPYEPDLGGGTVQVAAVQGDVPGAGDDVVPVHREVTRNHVETTAALAEEVAEGLVAAPAFVVWPENSTAVDPFTDTRTRAGITEAVEAIGVPVVVGGIVDAPSDGQVLNQGVVWDPVTGPGDRYSKNHPVPFGEYIPFRNSTFTQMVDQFDLIPRDMLAGTRTTPLQVAGIAVGNAICFDVAYDDLFRDQVTHGAELLTVQTSNAMFIRTHQIDQQFEITRLRAIESGRYLVVAAINGRSAIVAPDGSVVATIDERTQGAVSGEVVLISQVPPGLRVGPWIAGGAFAATIIGILLGTVGRLARRRLGRSHVTSRSATTTATEATA